MATKRFLGLDIGYGTVKLAEFASTKSGALTLVNFGHAPLEIDPDSEEDRNPFIVAALKKLLAAHPFKANRVAVSVSGQVVLMRFMKLPASDEAKIRQMVRYEAAQNVPFPMEEVVWDFQVVGGKGESELEVALVAIKSEIIEGFNLCAEQAGLDVEVVDVAPLAIYNSVLYNYEKEVNEGCTLVVDIGARTTNLIFIESKKVFARNIPIAGNTISKSVAQEFDVSFAEADAMKISEGAVGLGGTYEEPPSEAAAKLSKVIRNVMTRLHAEIARSINFYKAQQGGTAPRRLLLCGGTSILPYADHFFKEKMEIEVEYFNPFKNIPLQVPPEELEKLAHSMGEVVGLGLRLATECPIEINLVPPTVTKRRQFLKKIPFFVASMTGVLLLVGCWWLYYWKATKLLSEHLATVSGELEQMTRIEGGLAKAEQRVATVALQAEQVRQVIRARSRWLKFFEDLQRCAAAGSETNTVASLPTGVPAAVPPPGTPVGNPPPGAPTGSVVPAADAGKPAADAGKPAADAGKPAADAGKAPANPSRASLPVLWITQLTPENKEQPIGVFAATQAPPPSSGARPRKFGRPSAAPAPGAAAPAGPGAGTEMITGFEIRGLCLNDPNLANPFEPVDNFRAQLQKSEYFSDVGEYEGSAPDPKDWTFTFRMRVKLKEPIPF